MKRGVLFLLSFFFRNSFSFNLILLILSNTLVLWGNILGDDLKEPFFLILMTSVFMAYCVTGFGRILNQFKFKLLSKLYSILILFLLCGLLLVEGFLFFNFNIVFSKILFHSIHSATSYEITSFIEIYGIQVLLFCLLGGLGLCLFGYVSYKIDSIKIHSYLKIAFLYLPVIIGGLFFAKSVYNICNLQTSGDDAQISSISRLILAYTGYKADKRNIETFRHYSMCNSLKKNEKKCKTVIVVLGESFSKKHSSLYGYSKQTKPKLEKRKELGQLFLFQDVVSITDYTHYAMASIFPVTPNADVNKAKGVLFPAVFKKAGYKTYLLSNQYVVEGDQDDFFMKDKTVCQNMFDYRNDRPYQFDLEMINSIPDGQTEDYELFVYCLVGQHWGYDERYPKGFEKFTPQDYPPNNPHAKDLALYDNATLYNDLVIDEIIKKFEEREAFLVYFSDHGEEVFDYRDFMGHGCALNSSESVRLQTEVPFMIWVSALYQKKYPETVTRIASAINRPYRTSQISHLILDITGLDVEGFSPECSVIHPAFDASQDRIVLGIINYDKLRR